jgi:hypothetical protein
MYNILFLYICEIYWCSETVSHVTPCTIFCFTIYVRYTDVLKLYHMPLHVQYSVSIYMWDILMFWNCITCHSMYNILFQYTCQIYWCSETVSHVPPCTIFNCNVSRPHTTTLSITMLSDSHVTYNQYIITANNVYISCKINSCLLAHWCVLIFIKFCFSKKCSENISISTKVT